MYIYYVYVSYIVKDRQEATDLVSTSISFSEPIIRTGESGGRIILPPPIE
jgi:hypothetical protein